MTRASHELEPYEVFQQQKDGDAMRHGGNVMAPDPELALHYAREMFGRRNESTRLWVVRRADIAVLEHQLSEAQLKAPVNAIVRARLMEPGDMAAPQRPVYTLAIANPKWVRAYVAEADLGRIRPGMPATLTIDSQPGQPLSGKVGYISSVAEFTPKTVQTEELRTALVYEVRVLADDKADRLRMGMPATVRIVQ